MNRIRRWIEVDRRRALRAAALAVAAAGAALLVGASLHRVTVVIDGEARQVWTAARTVSGAVREAGLVLRRDDTVLPARGEPMQGVQHIDVRTARPVRIEVDGDEQQVVTASDEPENILGEAGLRIFPGDRVWVDGLPLASSRLPERPARIRVERGLAVQIDGKAGKTALLASGATLGQALWESGIRLRAADIVFPSVGSPLEGATGIRYEAASPIKVEADGAVVTSWAAGSSVGQALANAGVPLVGLDYSRPDAEGSIPDDGSVQVVRVTEGVELDQTLGTFETRWEPSPEIEIDHQQLVDPGASGVVAVRTRVRYEDGRETKRTSEPEWVAVEARDRIMGYGTKIVIRTLDTPDGPIEYWRAVPMYATSYYPCGLGIPGYCDSTMANGETLQHGNAAFIVPWYRVMRGQYVYVPGYGTAKISDTGGGIPGRRWIDLGYGSREEYVSWHGWTTVYFRTPVPPEGLIMWVLD